MKLRPYQRTWLRRIHRAQGRVLVVGPTGAGKTVVAVNLIRKAVREGKRVLFLAHRTELVSQCVARLHEARFKRVAVIQANVPGDESQPVQVASVQTLARRPELMVGYDVVIIDEAHHATAQSYRTILAANPDAQVYGLTATPRRLDGKPLDDLFDSVAQSEPVSRLIECGALNRPRVFSVAGADLTAVATRGGDYDRATLSETVNKRQLIGDAIRHWERYAEGRPTVVYAVDVAHATAVTKRFAKEGYRARLVTGETPHDERRAILDGLTTGDTQLVVNVEVLTEGWDCPDVSCAVILRPTMSETLAMQMAGRAMRRNGKWPHAIILDHAGNYIVHGLPSEDRDYADVLTAGQVEKRRHGDNAARSKACPSCGSEVGFGSRVCGFCDHAFWTNEPPAEVAGWLEEVTTNKRDRALELSVRGFSSTQVAEMLNIKCGLVRAWRHRAGITSPTAKPTPATLPPGSAAHNSTHEALRLRAAGWCNKDIAEHLGVSVCSLRMRWSRARRANVNIA